MGTKKPDFLKCNDDGSVTVTLSRPIEVNGAKLSTLTMREPTVDDQLAISDVKGADVLKDATMFANLCTVSPAYIRRLPLRDFMRLQAAFADFID